METTAVDALLEMRQIAASLELAIQQNVLAAARKKAVRLSAPNSGDIIIHPSTREPGRWQLSWFFRDGLAGGHGTFDSMEDAIASATGKWVNGPAYGASDYRVEGEKP